jgi:hypothetical protein
MELSPMPRECKQAKPTSFWILGVLRPVSRSGRLFRTASVKSYCSITLHFQVCLIESIVEDYSFLAWSTRRINEFWSARAIWDKHLQSWIRRSGSRHIHCAEIGSLILDVLDRRFVLTHSAETWLSPASASHNTAILYWTYS